MPESPYTPSTSVRTIMDVTRERGENYPGRECDSVNNKRDRWDFLVAAYDIISKRDAGTLLRILKMSPSNRVTIIKSFVSRTGQLKLEGIFKKIVSYDQGDRVRSVDNDDILRMLLELRAMFEPETELPRDFLPPPAATKKVAPVMAQRVTGILNRTPIHPTSASKKVSASTSNKTHSTLQTAPFIEPRSNGGSKQNTESEDILIPAFLRKRRRVSPTPIPRGEKPVPTYLHTPEPTVTPPTEGQTNEVVSRPKTPTLAEIPKVPEPTPMNMTFPESLGYEESLEWLRNEPTVQVGLDAVETEISAYTRDDLSIRALFKQDYPLLHTAFSRMQKLTGNNWMQIIHDIYHPDPLVILKKDTTLIKQWKGCFEHHKSGNYQEFSHSLIHHIRDEDTLTKIMALQEKYEAKTMMEVIAHIIEFPWTPEDAWLYETISLRDVLRRVLEIKGKKVAIFGLLSEISYRELSQKLEQITVAVPLGETSWIGYRGIGVSSSTLLHILQELIKNDASYKKGDEKSTKKIRHKLVEIVGE